MNTYQVVVNKELSAQVKADFFELREDKRIVFYKEEARDDNPSGIEVVAMFDGPISVVKMEVGTDGY